MNLWFLLVLYTVCSSAGLLLIKTGLNKHELGEGSIVQAKNLLRVLYSGNIQLGFALYVTGFLIWLYILSKYDLSMVFPLAIGVTYVGLLIGSTFWLHEEISAGRIVGVFLILTGIVFVSRS